MDTRIIGKDIDIRIGLTPMSESDFANNTKENNSKLKFKNKKYNCHPFPNKTLHNAIKKTGTEKKNKDGLLGVFSRR